MLGLYLLFAAVTIRADGTVLRTGCAGDAEQVALLQGGQTAEVKFALAGADGPCYKVAVQVDGRTVAGYVRKPDLADADEFEHSRRQGGAIRAPVAAANLLALERRATLAAGTSVELRTAIQAINANEPARASAILEPLARNSRDRNVLAMAGVAAWRNDDPAAALSYWKRALDLHPDAELERLYAKVGRESVADRSSARLLGLRVLLRYEPNVVDEETARRMLLTLDEELSRISTQLGCAVPERLVAIVQQREAYLRASGAEEWSAGQYDGRIRVALMDERGVGPHTRRAFAHELTHACLANIGRFPTWLHEGIAQRMSGDRLTAEARRNLTEAISARRLPKLEALAAHGAGKPRDIYDLALLATDLLLEKHGEMGIRNILANPSLLEQITTELDRELGL